MLSIVRGQVMDVIQFSAESRIVPRGLSLSAGDPSRFPRRTHLVLSLVHNGKRHTLTSFHWRDREVL